MALIYWETFDSGSGSLGKDAQDEFSIIVKGDPNPQTDNADDFGVIMRFAMPKFAAISGTGNIINNFDRQKIAPGTWRVTARYRSATDDRATNDSSFSFSTTGGTQHITCSRKTLGVYAPSGVIAPNFNGLINVGSDKNAAGCDIAVPVFNFKVTAYASTQTLVQSGIVPKLYKNVGYINTDSVTVNVDGINLTFQPGELLFLGAEGSKRRGFGDWELTTDWAASASVQNMSLGNITGISKPGWAYLWVYYGPALDSASNQTVSQPTAVYVEQVYPDGSDHSSISNINGSSGTSTPPDWTNTSSIDTSSGPPIQ